MKGAGAAELEWTFNWKHPEEVILIHLVYIHKPTQLFRSRCQVSKREGGVGKYVLLQHRWSGSTIMRSGKLSKIFFLHLRFYTHNIQLQLHGNFYLQRSCYKGKKRAERAFSRGRWIEKDGVIWQFSILLIDAAPWVSKIFGLDH